MATRARRITIIVHGGAGWIADDALEAARAGVDDAARAGFAVLHKGGTAVEAVEAAVRALEDNARFNAGTGSVLTRDGTVEMDCLLMEGAHLRVGAATGVKRIRNPISLARRIMESSPHVFLYGPTAEAFAESCGMDVVPNESLITDARRAQLAQFLAKPGPVQLAQPTTVDASTGVAGDPLAGHDTVGAVAIDAEGHVAAATSTGGLTGKWAGRIGDTPVVGAGGYANDEVGAVSTTGTGEFIIRFGLAREVLHTYARLRAAAAASPTAATPGLATAAVEETLHRMRERLGDPGEGVIFVTPQGDIGVGHSSKRMSWAAISSESDYADPVCAAGCTAAPSTRYPGVHAGLPDA